MRALVVWKQLNEFRQVHQVALRISLEPGLQAQDQVPLAFADLASQCPGARRRIDEFFRGA